jgi:hypothetical protein
MDTLKKHLNTVGLGLLFAAFIAARVWPAIQLLPVILAVLGRSSTSASSNGA